jgi:asparagine synthase (glutamine-hydrolysing)
MPGVYGYTKRTPVESSQLNSMSDAMKLYDHFVQDDQYEDVFVAAARTHLGHIGEKSSPHVSGEFLIWVEGEAYNLPEVTSVLQLNGLTLAAILADAERSHQLDACLNKLDGYFCAALYDRQRRTVKLISDRYGMRILYWYCRDGFFAWGSEIKAILALDGVDKTLDPKSFDCFMDLGYLIGEHTWFEYVRLIKPATIIEYDIKSDVFQQHHYWKWSDIQPSSKNFKKAVDELGELFIQAVARRFNPNERVGISLSGGLDSRAIFAALNHLYPDYEGYAYTFGIPGCDDITIAEQVAARSEWKHEKFFFDDKNWFEPRIKKIWDTDGMLDMMHMHGSEFLGEVSKHIDVNLNGYAGDAILGGSFLVRIPLNERIDADNSKIIYKAFHSMGDIQSDFYDIDHVEPNLYMNRMRRFTNYGSVNVLTSVSQRKPFFDNKLMALIFSLPDDYRVDNKLYSAMLQKFFSKLFLDIPWQKTGKPAGVINKASIAFRALNKARRIIMNLLNVQNTKGFTDYPEWIRSPEIAQSLIELLNLENAQYTRLTNENLKEKYLQPHLATRAKNYSNEILRAATVEFYLRRVFRKDEL